MSNDPRTVAAFGQDLIQEVEKAIIGKRPLLTRVSAAVLAGGHVLIEDYPGLGKTLLAKSLASALGLAFRRIQFTPDLLPGDITGGYVFDRTQSRFELRKGPLFANIILADEINRASPKTQSALLEAMQEGQVTLEGESLPLPRPFLVLATQNPIEYEGTFPLPEAQLDRFIMKVSVGYPAAGDEIEMLERRRARGTDEVDILQVTDGKELLQLSEAVEKVHIHADLSQYIIDLVNRTREDKQVLVGASPRGSLALLKLSRAAAALDGRDFVLPDDIKDFAVPALVHRLILKPDLWLKRFAAEEVITNILASQPVPVIESDA